MINLTLSDHNTFKNIKVEEKTLKGLKQQEDYQFISNACKISSCSCSPCEFEIALTKALTSEMSLCKHLGARSLRWVPRDLEQKLCLNADNYATCPG